MYKYLYTRNYMLKWLIVATLVGLGGGLSAALLSALIDLIQSYSTKLPLFIAPIIGGVIVAVIFLREPMAKGFGTNRYMDYANKHKHVLPIRLWFYKILATAVTIGFHGSGGVEGPMLVIGGSISSGIKKVKFISKYFSEDERRTLAICGAAGAIGAIFRSPLGGGVFVVEILYRSSLHYADLFPAMLSSMMGYVIYSMITGKGAFFTIPDYVPNIGNVPLFIVAAILSGVASLLFMKLFKYTGKAFKRCKVRFIKPIIGGVLTGAVIFFLPSVSGAGSSVIQNMISGHYSIVFLLAVIFGKMLATSFTVNSGGSAGLVIPALFVGAASGAIISKLVLNSHEGLTASLTIAGMAAALSGIANVPVAASIMLVEMVGLTSAVPAVIGSVIGYSINHSQVIYDVSSPDHLVNNDMTEWRLTDLNNHSH